MLLISFDHVDLRRAKERHSRHPHRGHHPCPARRSGGVARAARLDSLSIELDRFHPDDARALHAAGDRDPLPRAAAARARPLQRYGIDPLPELREWLAAGLIDTLSGDDVKFLADLVARSPLR